MGIAVRAGEIRVQNLSTRMPFRYGIATMSVVPHVVVNPEILGGVIVKVDERVMDGSVRRRLALLRASMLRAAMVRGAAKG